MVCKAHVAGLLKSSMPKNDAWVEFDYSVETLLVQ